MVKTLMNLQCNVGFTDEKIKQEILCNDKGQTALYWIVTKMPDIVNLISNIFNEDDQILLPLGRRCIRSVT